MNSQNGLRVSCRERNFLPYFTNGGWRHFQKGSNVLQVDLLDNLRTATEQLHIPLFHGQAVGIEMLGINLKKQMLIDITHLVLHGLVHLNKRLQYLAIYQKDLARRLRNNRNARIKGLHAIRKVTDELIRKGETRDIVFLLYFVMHHILETPLHDESQPTRPRALTFQCLAPVERLRRPMLHAIFSQELQVESFLIGIEVLFHLVFIAAKIRKEMDYSPFFRIFASAFRIV